MKCDCQSHTFSVRTRTDPGKTGQLVTLSVSSLMDCVSLFFVFPESKRDLEYQSLH